MNARPDRASPSTLSLELRSASAQEALLTGYLLHDGLRERVIAREQIVIGARDAARREVIFEVLPETAWRPSRARQLRQALRPLSLTTTATPCLAALIHGWVNGWTIQPFLAVSALMGAIALQVSIHAYNDVEDHLKLVDFPGSANGSGVIQKGWWTALEMRRLARRALLAGALLGLPSLCMRPDLLTWIAAAGGLGVLGYSGRPFALKYRTLGDLAVFALCGPGLAAGFSLAAFGLIDGGTIWIGAYFGFAAAAILHANNLHDLEIDASRGARTLAVALGFRTAQRLLPALYLAAILSLALGVRDASLPAWSLAAPAAALPGLYLLCRNALRASGPFSSRLEGVRVRATRAHLELGVFLCLVLAVGGWLAARMGGG